MSELFNFTPLASAQELATAARRRGRQLTWAGLFLGVATAGVLMGVGIQTPLVPIALLFVLVTPVLLWHYPRISFYVTLAAACLFEIEPRQFSDEITGLVPFFWNVNTIFQRYAHVDFKAVPLNFFEVVLLVAGTASLLRATFQNGFSLKKGPLFWPVFIYVCFVAFGLANGLATGGDFKIALQEVRAQFYFLIAYLMALNFIKDRAQLRATLWITALCIGIKGILYSFRYLVTLHGMPQGPLADQGVGSHEEVFFFDAFLVLLILLWLGKVERALQWVMLALLPTVMIGNFACNRRAGTAALAVAIPILILAAYRALPDRRKLVGGVGLVLVVALSIYYPMYKDSTTLVGQPARAIKSQFQPDDRDASSNAYRDAESADLMATVSLSPLVGYGYGKRMLHAVPIADISQYYEWWDILTHNQILWVWMRVGTFGFFTFWIMITAIVAYVCREAHAAAAGIYARVVCIFGAVLIGMLLIFGLLDLQLSNFRDMLFTGIWIGSAVATRETPSLRVQEAGGR